MLLNTVCGGEFVERAIREIGTDLGSPWTSIDYSVRALTMTLGVLEADKPRELDFEIRHSDLRIARLRVIHHRPAHPVPFPTRRDAVSADRGATIQSRETVRMVNEHVVLPLT